MSGLAPKETGAVPGGTVLRLFFSTSRTRQVLVLVCLLLGGLAESVGIASLLPVLAIVGGDTEATASSPMHRALMGLLELLRLEPSLPTLFGLILVGLWLRGLLLLVAMSSVAALVAELATGLRLGFYKETDFGGFFQTLRDVASAAYQITDAQERFHSILIEMRRAKGTTKLKIEVRKKVAPSGSSEQKIAFSPHFPSQVLVRGFTLKQMFKYKVSALIERGEIRDAFDLEFLFRKGIEGDLSDEEKKSVKKGVKGFK